MLSHLFFNSHDATLQPKLTRLSSKVFDILRNKCILDLNGESGDDSFTVRSFIAAIADDNETLIDPELGNVTLFGGDDNDSFNIDKTGNTRADQQDESQNDPDYLINSLVDVDGGTGSNNLTVVGTEAGDNYVVEDGKVYGGGLTVKYTNIAFLAVSGEEGDDTIVVLSTNPSVLLSLYGSLGSDEFIITPRSVSPVISKNLRGHRGIIEHTVISDTDSSYDGLVVSGVQADVHDNDGNFGWIFTVDQGGFHLLSEDGMGEFTFQVYPTTKPENDTYVNIVAPAARDKNRYVRLNNKTVAEILYFPAGDMTPRNINGTCLILFVSQLASFSYHHLLTFLLFSDLQPRCNGPGYY